MLFSEDLLCSDPEEKFFKLCVCVCVKAWRLTSEPARVPTARRFLHEDLLGSESDVIR